MLTPQRSTAAESPLATSDTPVPYSKFVILTLGRSGSTMLTRMLAQHAGVVSYNELFNLNFDPGRVASPTRGQALQFWASTVPAEKLLRPPDMSEAQQAGADRILGEFVWHRGYAPQVQTVGFKLLHDQMRPSGPYPNLATRLRCWLPEVRVVVIHRGNLLRRHLSMVAANRIKQWHVFDDRQRRPRPTLRFQPRKLRAAFERAERQHAELDELAGRGLAVHRLSYESLVADLAAHWASLQDFLQISPVPRPPLDLLPTETRPLPEAIENYAELKRHFQGTRWADCFDE